MAPVDPFFAEVLPASDEVLVAPVEDLLTVGDALFLPAADPPDKLLYNNN